MLSGSVLAGDAEKQGNAAAHDLVREQEEDAGKHRHDDHHNGRDRGLAAARPNDLGSLAAHLLEKSEGIESFGHHRLMNHRRANRSIARAPDLEALT